MFKPLFSFAPELRVLYLQFFVFLKKFLKLRGWYASLTALIINVIESNMDGVYLLFLLEAIAIAH